MEFSAVAEFCRLTSFHSEERLKKQIEVPQWLKTRQQSLAEDDAIEAFRAKDEGANEKKAAAAAAPKALPIVVEEKAETVVAKMMQSKMDELLVSHPLRSFGCKLVVSLFHHVKGNVKPGRMMVVLEDTVRYPQFREWVQVCLWGAPCKAGEELILQYTNEFGESITINNGASLASWLDIMWYKHPPELNVYEVEALLERQQATMDAAQDLFALYDADNSGKIEVKEMLMTKEMADMLGLPRETLLEFHKEMFHEMDVNGDGSVSYDEFVAHFNQLNSALKSGLMRDHHKYSRNRLQSLTLEASSYRIALAEIANQPARTVDDVTSGRGGRLSLDGNDGCDYAIELRFPVACVTEENKGMWVQASTMLEEKVDHFIDGTEVQGKGLGRLCSPIVLVEFEPGLELPRDYEVSLPHSFCELSKQHLPGDTEPLAKDDFVVATASLDMGAWTALDEAKFELVSGAASPLGLPSVRILTRSAGVFAVFSLAHAEVAQRVQCLAFTKEILMPLEAEELAVYIAPDLPNAIEEVVFQETQERGLVKLVGWSEVAAVCAKDTLINVEVSYGDEKPQTKELKWDGNVCRLAFVFAPDEWRSRSEDFVEGKPMEATYAVKLGLTRSVGRRRLAHARPDRTISFNCLLAVHNFPPPSAPLELTVKSRNMTGIALSWQMPKLWGGCAIAKYEIHLRQKAKDGKFGEWVNVDTRHGYALNGYLYKNVFAGEVKMRAFNIGSLEPGPWSNVVVMEPEKAKSGDNEAAAAIARKKSFKAPKNKLERMESMTAEGGVAVIAQQGIEKMIGKKFHSVSKMEGWSDFCKAIGAFYLEVGVWGGVEGKLFELTPQRVEELVLGVKPGRMSSASASDEEIKEYHRLISGDPLIGLASCAVWVLETLAHHTENSGQWIETLNAIEGMINFAAHETSVVSAELQSENVRAILYTLIQVYETMRQSDPGGYVSSQLAHRYNKLTRQTLKKEMESFLQRLKSEIAAEASQMALNNSQLGLKSHTSSMNITFDRVLKSETPVLGALGLKAKYALKKKDSMLTSVSEVTFLRLSAESLPAGVVRPQLEISSEVASSSVKTLSDTTNSRRNPMWVGQRLSLPLLEKFKETKLEKPFTIQVRLLSEGKEFACATGSLTDAVGRFIADLKKGEGDTKCGRVNFVYKVNAWMERS